MWWWLVIALVVGSASQLEWTAWSYVFLFTTKVRASEEEKKNKITTHGNGSLVLVSGKHHWITKLRVKVKPETPQTTFYREQQVCSQNEKYSHFACHIHPQRFWYDWLGLQKRHLCAKGASQKSFTMCTRWLKCLGCRPTTRIPILSFSLPYYLCSGFDYHYQGNVTQYLHLSYRDSHSKIYGDLPIHDRDKM